MKKINSTLAAFFLIGLCLFAFAAESDAATKKMKLSHPRPLTTLMHQDMELFAAKVKEYTEGRVELILYGAGQLGSSEAVMESVGMGTVEIMLGWPNTTLDQRLEVYSMTGLAMNYDEAAKVYKQGSPYMDILQDVYASQNHKILATYPTSFCCMSFIKEPKDIYNPEAKHTEKMRVAPINALRYMPEAIGYITSPVPWGETFTALQTGVVDGLGHLGPELTYLTFRNVIKYYFPVNLYLDVYLLSINLELWEELSQADRDAISKAAAEIEVKRFKDAPDEQQSWVDKLEESGVKILPITDEQQTTLQLKVRDFVWTNIKNDIGLEFFEKVTKAAEESKK